MLKQNKRLLGIVIAVPVLLLIPFTAMMLTSEVNWTLPDFVVMGGLLLGTGLACEFVLRTVTKTSHRIAICAVIFAAFLLVWAELAVEILGTPFAGS